MDGGQGNVGDGVDDVPGLLEVLGRRTVYQHGHRCAGQHELRDGAVSRVLEVGSSGQLMRCWVCRDFLCVDQVG